MYSTERDGRWLVDDRAQSCGGRADDLEQVVTVVSAAPTQYNALYVCLLAVRSSGRRYLRSCLCLVRHHGYQRQVYLKRMSEVTLDFQTNSFLCHAILVDSKHGIYLAILYEIAWRMANRRVNIWWPRSGSWKGSKDGNSLPLICTTVNLDQRLIHFEKLAEWLKTHKRQRGCLSASQSYTNQLILILVSSHTPPVRAIVRSAYYHDNHSTYCDSRQYSLVDTPLMLLYPIPLYLLTFTKCPVMMSFFQLVFAYCWVMGREYCTYNFKST